MNKLCPIRRSVPPQKNLMSSSRLSTSAPIASSNGILEDICTSPGFDNVHVLILTGLDPSSGLYEVG